MLSFLIVDDDVDFAQSLADMIAALGHQAQISHSGSEAMSALSTGSFDVILIDLKLPDGAGTTWLERINEVVPAARKLMITGFVDEGVEQRCRVLGVEELLIKPFSVRPLVDRLVATS